MASPELQQIIAMLRAAPMGGATSIEEMRQGMEMITASAGHLPADVTFERLQVNGVPAERVTVPGIERDRVVLFLHGGGYVAGSARTHRELAGRLARAAGAAVLLPEYRLAPEHPFPAAVEDSVASYRFLLDQGFSPGRIAIAGDSAGGGLTMATLLALRDAKLPLPGAAVGLSPWLDLEGVGESMTSRAALDPMVQKEPLLKMAALYLNGADPKSPLASPLHGDLTGLPPLFLQVGTAESLFDDSIRFAEKARAAGVDVTLETWDDMIHVWHAFAILAEAGKALESVGRFVRAKTSAA